MKFRIHHWPALVSIWTTFSFGSSYVVAVAVKSVYPFFPYISDTGVKPPSSCLFSLTVNIAALFTGIALYIRYRQVNLAIKTGIPHLTEKLNKNAFWIGNIVSFGVCMVGNFQANMDMKPIFMFHMLGAFLAFGIGTVYLIMQTIISFRLQAFYDEFPQYGISYKLKYLRVAIVSCYCTAMLLVMIFGPLSLFQFTGDKPLWYTEDFPGYGFHLTATISEWILACMFLAYLMSFTNEFKLMSYEGIVMNSNL